MVSTEITITRSETGYNVTYGPGAYGDEVEALFGTRTLPTPFTPQASGERVAKDVSARHVGWRIVCAY